MTEAIASRLHNPPLERFNGCDTHGPYLSHCYLGDVWTACPECTQQATETQRRAAAEKELAQAVARWLKTLGHAGIPPRFQDRSLDNFRATNPGQVKALAFAKSYADGFADAVRTGKSAIFTGKPGTGKTHLAAGIGMQLLKGGRKVLFTTVIRALRRVKDSWGKEAQETETQAVKTLVTPDLLILDEVGVQFGSDTEKLLLFDILNERYENRRPVLLLSNLNLEGTKTYLGERIFDRLREDGGEHVPFDWDSYRGKSA